MGQPAGKFRTHKATPDALVERLELPPAHAVKQHRNRGHLRQRHRARPAAALFVAALVEQTLRKQRLELRTKSSMRQKSAAVLSMMGHLHKHRVREFCQPVPSCFHTLGCCLSRTQVIWKVECLHGNASSPGTAPRMKPSRGCSGTTKPGRIQRWFILARRNSKAHGLPGKPTHELGHEIRNPGQGHWACPH